MTNRCTDRMQVIARTMLVREACWRNQRVTEEPVTGNKREEEPWETVAWDFKVSYCPKTKNTGRTHGHH